MATVVARLDGDHLRAALHQHGMRCTTPRLQVLRVLECATGHLSTGEIHARLTNDAADSATSLTTVYRVLETLQQLGLAHPLVLPEQPVRFGLSDPPHHHAICTLCAQVSEVDATALRGAVRIAATASEYQLADAASLQLHGICRTCRQLPTS